MKRYFTRARVVMLVLAVILSLGVTRWNSISSVPPCINSPSCNSDEVGKLTNRQHGYPLTYRQVLSFEPSDKTNYATSSVESFNYINVLINIVFWFALMDMVRRIYNLKRTPEKK